MARVAGRILYWVVTFQLGRGLRLRRAARLIRRSHLFDAEFYLQQCAAEPSAHADPLGHFLTRGGAAGLDPNPLFDTRFYLRANPDVRATGENPLVHYIRQGGWEGRSCSARFDGDFYMERYPDVVDSGWPTPLAHFLRQGCAEGRLAIPAASATPGAVGEVEPALVPDLLDWAHRRDASLARRVLVVDHRMLSPDCDSGSVRLLAIIRILRAAGVEVTFCSDCPAREFVIGERSLEALGAKMLFGPEAIVSHLLTQGELYGTALLSRPEVMRRYLPLVRGYAPQAAVVYDTVDLHWVRNLRAHELTGDPAAALAAERYRHLELLGTAAADRTLTVTAEERDILLREVAGASVAVVPNIHECLPPVAPWKARRDLMFIGGYEHPPNVDGVEWFVKEILPLVRAAIPGVVFHVVGSKAPERIRALAGDGVDVVGYVLDPAPLFQGSRVFVSPLRFGAGMKGKIGQSMGFGLPVVTTRIGAEGMGLVSGTNALVADDPAEFAEAVVRLYSDELLWARVSRAATSHLEQHFSEQAVRERVLALLAPAAVDARSGLAETPR